LSPGYQAVQSSHALLNFAALHPEQFINWNKESNYLLQVSCNNESELELYIKKCDKKHIKCVIFREPDLNNEVTAIALEPTLAALKLVSNLPLMLKNVKND
jgi:hypothetical protein